jgi:hypothetical protein
LWERMIGEKLEGGSEVGHNGRGEGGVGMGEATPEEHC